MVGGKWRQLYLSNNKKVKINKIIFLKRIPPLGIANGWRVMKCGACKIPKLSPQRLP